MYASYIISYTNEKLHADVLKYYYIKKRYFHLQIFGHVIIIIRNAFWKYPIMESDPNTPSAYR